MKLGEVAVTINAVTFSTGIQEGAHNMKMHPGDYIHKSDIPDEMTHNRIREAVRAMGYKVRNGAGQWGRRDGPKHEVIVLTDFGDLVWRSTRFCGGRRFTPADLLNAPEATSMTWQDVCRELLRLDAEGYDEPWRELEWFNPSEQRQWKPGFSIGHITAQAIADGVSVRLKPRTVRVTTHSGEVLELPEPWWDVPEGVKAYLLHGSGVAIPEYAEEIVLDYARQGNAFRTRQDAQAWADAMPRIRGRG